MCEKISENAYDEIIDHLFVGSASALTESDNFDLIVNCNPDIFIKYPNKTIRIPIKDSQDECNKLLQLLKDTDVLEKIKTTINNKQKVLVHCYAGQQRSCAVVACYLIKYNNMNPYTAVNYIKMKRRIAFFGEINFISAIINFFYTL
jgi:protein-tyrosine phosphatase